MSGVDKSLATNSLSPQAWGLPTTKGRPLSPDMVVRRNAVSPAPAAAPAQVPSIDPGLRAPVAPGDFLAQQRRMTQDPAAVAAGKGMYGDFTRMRSQLAGGALA